MKAFTVMGRILKAAYEDLFICVFLSIAWWIGTILVLPAAPVMVAMHRVTNRIANYKRVDNSFFWEALRQHIGKGWLLYGISLLIPLAVFMNVWFYLYSTSSWLNIIGIAWLWALLLVVMVLQYIFPLFWQQDEPEVRMILRNALLLVLRYPLYTLLILFFQLFLLIVSIALTLPLILLTPALLALTANFAVTGILQEMDLAPEPPEMPSR